MNDFEVREMAGVYGAMGGTKRWVEVREMEACINITIGSQETYVSASDARKLANQLRRVAKRIEKRLGAPS